MKKTLIALLALSSVAMGDTAQQITEIMPKSYGSSEFLTKKQGAEWSNMGWGNYTPAILQKDFPALGIEGDGNYYFNSQGLAEQSAGHQVDFSDNVLHLIGRSGIGRDTDYCNVISVASLLPSGQVQDLTALSLTMTVYNYSGADAWLWLYKMDNSGNITGLFTDTNTGASNPSDLRAAMTGVEEDYQVTLALNDTQLEALNNTDKLVALLRVGSKGVTTDLKAASYTATYNQSVPEPTTGSLSLLALAGLCARRRKK